MKECFPTFNILILNGDLPVFPGWGGIEFLHTTNLARLAEKVGLVSLVHTSEQREKKQALIDAGVHLFLWENPNSVAVPGSPDSAIKIPSLGKRVGKAIFKIFRMRVHRPLDTLIQDLVFRNLSGPLHQAFGAYHWQALVIVQSNCARWLDFLPGFPVTVLVLHDVRALLYERKRGVVRSKKERWACSVESWFYRRFERHYCHKYDLIVTVSPADEAWVRKNYGLHRVITIPIPVDGNYFTPFSSLREDKARILFSGMMNHPPNVDAACFFAQEVFPQVKAEIPEAEFWIVGRDPAPSVQALQELPGVIVTGFVPDIRPYIAQATVFVVPLRFGSGMRQKILEAWAMEKCVISTSLGAEGLNYRDGENILIADGASVLAQKTVQALRSPSLRHNVCSQGRQLVATDHHPEKLAQRYYQAIASALKAKKDKNRNAAMKAVIDLRWMRPGVAGGIENLSRSFLRNLMPLDQTNQYTLLVPSEVKYDFDNRRNPNFRIRVMDSPIHLWRRGLGELSHRLNQRLRIGALSTPEFKSLLQARSFGAEIALSIPGYIAPDLHPFLNVLIVPDIQHEYHPEFFPHAVLAERKKVYTHAIQRADHICAISEFTRQTLIEKLKVSPGKISVTHLAADPIYHRGNHPPQQQDNILKKYNLQKGKYLFFPGHTWPHKNHPSAVKALRLLRESYHWDLMLVCTGKPKESHPDLMKLICGLNLDSHVRFLGYCPMIDMPFLYGGAAALVFPSLFEGFGIPLIEAMWCGCPVVCSNLTSLPEIAEDAGLTVDPHSPEEIASSVHRLLTDDNLRQTLIARGQRQAKKFSWEKFTLSVVKIMYRTRESYYGRIVGEVSNGKNAENHCC